MNKATKGALAAGAASLLLLGGAGSYALWSDTESVAAGTVTAGVLDIALTSPGTWFDASPDRTRVSIEPITTFRMVPGDVLEYDATFTITATGKNLTATVNAVPTSLTYTGGLSASNIALATSATIDGAAVANNAITSADTGKTVVVKSTITFDRNTANQVGQSGTVNLSAFQVAVQQTRPTTP